MLLIKILVVDDSSTDRLIIKNMLSEYNILTACDGLEAMRLIEEHEDINLIILDLNMPIMDGFQVLTALKSNDRYKNLRTIILTNFDELDYEIKGLKLGAVDYIRKPIQMDSLKARIEIHVELLRVQNALQQKLHEQGLTFDKIFNQAPVGIAISFSNEETLSGNNIYFSVNPMFEKITGRTQDELRKLGWANITHPDDLKEDLENYEKLQSGQIDGYSMEKRYIKPDASIVWVHLVVASLKLSNDHQYNHISLVQNITNRKAIEARLMESERSKSVLLSHIPGMAYRCNYDHKRTMQFVSAGCFALTGYHPENLMSSKDLSFTDLIAGEYRTPLWKEWECVLAEQKPFNYEYEITTAKGEKKWVLEKGQGVYNEQGEVEALEGIILDISDLKNVENNLRYTNEHDRWTGLFNRSYLENLLNCDANRIDRKKSALMSINLSTLQSLTSTYGFHYTQDLIKKIVDALSVYCTEKRQLFNTYENQFVFYLQEYNEKNELLEFCETITDTLNSLFAIERIGGGIGIIEINPENGKDVDQLLRKVLIASERAIELFDNDFGVSFYDTEIEVQMIREQEIKHEINLIAANEEAGRLFLQYQPILDLKSNQISGFEALARIKSDQLGLVPPLEFIPIAEETKLIIPIGNKVILQAFQFLNKLREHGYISVNISINISVIQLLKKDFVKNLLDMMLAMNIHPGNVSLEITESVFSSNYLEINRVLGVLKDAGLQIAIDDFGTGYSSLAREWELNINCLKIDKSFIKHSLSLNPDKSIIGNIVSMAHKSNHYVIAEGVEYEEQRQYLLSCGCDMIQGYLIGKPLDEDAAIDFLKQQTATNNES